MIYFQKFSIKVSVIHSSHFDILVAILDFGGHFGFVWIMVHGFLCCILTICFTLTLHAKVGALWQ